MEQIEINFTFSKQASGCRKMLVLQAAATANQLTTDSDGCGYFSAHMITQFLEFSCVSVIFAKFLLIA